MHGMSEDYQRTIAALRTGSAPEFVEQNMLVAFRRQKKARAARRWGLGTLAATVALAAAGVYWTQRPNTIAPPAPLVSHIAAPQFVEPAPAPPMRHRRMKRREEIVSPYYPLPSADSLPAPDAEAVVRMMVPRSTLQLVGFPLSEVPRPEFIRADVVVGQDGMARAIRFVQ
jgi:hypothetical protein